MPAGTSDPKKKGKNGKKNAPAHIVGGGTPIMHSEKQILGGRGEGGVIFHTSIVATPFEILT